MTDAEQIEALSALLLAAERDRDANLAALLREREDHDGTRERLEKAGEQADAALAIASESQGLADRAATALADEKAAHAETTRTHGALLREDQTAADELRALVAADPDLPNETAERLLAIAGGLAGAGF